MPQKFFQGKAILLISPEPWSHLFVSKHHYAIELGKRGNKVYFLNPPSSSFSFRATEYQNVWEVSHNPFIKGIRFLPTFIQKNLFRKRFNQIQQMVSQRFDCVWSFDNSVFFDFSFLDKAVLSISHIVDYSQNFQFERAATSARICFGVSQNIVDRLRRVNPNSHLITHGLAVDLFKNEEVILPGANTLKAMYAGKLDSIYFDKSTLYDLVRKHRNIDFVVLGSGAKVWSEEPNLFLIGKVRRESLMNYLRKADVLLILYDFEKFPEQLTNAHKILEYLNAGKVVVSNFFSDYAQRGDLLQMAKSKPDILSVFGDVISNLEKFNTLEQIESRKNYARANTYSTRVDEIENIIETTAVNYN